MLIGATQHLCKGTKVATVCRLSAAPTRCATDVRISTDQYYSGLLRRLAIQPQPIKIPWIPIQC